MTSAALAAKSGVSIPASRRLEVGNGTIASFIAVASRLSRDREVVIPA